MTLLATLAKWEIGLLIAGLAATVAIQLMQGEIRTRRMLYSRTTTDPPRYYFSPERVQLLAITLIAAGWYLLSVATNREPGKFPDIPESMTAIVGGSNMVYLGGKAWARWWAK